MGPFTALMTVDDTAVATSNEKRSFLRTVAARVSATIETVRRDASDRRLRDQLADMDSAMLKDIGIADDEIHLIRARSHFTPRAWADRGVGKANWQF